MAIIKKVDNKYCWYVNKLEPSYDASGTVKWYSHLKNQSASSSEMLHKRLNIELPYDPFHSEVYTQEN